ncbi:hypothetical protein HZC30_08230 [Candidatus Woesearchaeota archaeon]|nr:hypothetical protein [Candidatus Woesearchaeota archaeon]
MVSLKDLIAGLPDKKALAASDKSGFSELPNLEEIDSFLEEIKTPRKKTLKEILEEIGVRMEKNMKVLPPPEEQPSSEPPSSEPPSIEKKLLDYQKAIDELANRAKSGTYVFLDNIFPIPLARNEFYGYGGVDVNEPRYSIKYPLIKTYSQALSFWRELLRTNKNHIFIPQECWAQAMAGKTCLERTERDERRSNFLLGKGLFPINPEVEQYLQEFAGLKNNCGQEKAIEYDDVGNIFYVWHEDRHAYDSLVSLVIKISERGGLKRKRNGNVHRNDAHADEVLVASAVYQTIKTKSPCLIVSNDGDIDRIRQAYLNQFEHDNPQKEPLNVDFYRMARLDD